VSLAAYYVLHVASMSNPAGYAAYLGRFGRSSMVAEIIGRFEQAALRYDALWSYSPAEFILILLTIGAALIRRTDSDAHWLRLLALNELGILIIHPQGALLTAYTAYSLPLLFAGTGALVIYGLQREERPASPWGPIAYAGTAAALITYSIAFINLTQQNAALQRTIYIPVTEALRERVPEGATIMALPGQIPYLTGYDVIMSPDFLDAHLSSDLAGMSNDAYWQRVMLERWPVALLNRHFLLDEPKLHSSSLEGSYFLSRGSTHPQEGLWVVDDTPLVTLPPDKLNDAPIQLVAYQPLTVLPPDAVSITLLFATRAELPDDLTIEIVMLDASGHEVPLAAAALIEDVDEMPTSEWRAYRFYAVTLLDPAPFHAPAGTYTLRARITGAESLCAPDCVIEVGQMEIE
jgi:hypothetical protein